MQLTEETALQLIRKIDLFLSAFGLSDIRRRPQVELVEEAQNDFLAFKRKRAKNDNKTSVS
jgi:hypothetical protein